MFVWDFPTPMRDGDLDAEVILHEATHGTSGRLVGAGVGISALQTAGREKVGRILLPLLS